MLVDVRIEQRLPVRNLRLYDRARTEQMTIFIVWWRKKWRVFARAVAHAVVDVVQAYVEIVAVETRDHLQRLERLLVSSRVHEVPRGLM